MCLGDAIMQNKKIKFGFFNKTMLPIIGVLLIVLSAVILLWQGNKNSNQAVWQLRRKCILQANIVLAMAIGKKL